jgi:hypothetical protein
MEQTPETTSTHVATRTAKVREKTVATKPPAKVKKEPARKAKKKPSAKAKPAAKAKSATKVKRALKKSRKPKATLKHPESVYVVKSTPIASKAAFIRSLPKDTPAKEVIARAKARGAVLTESYIYNIRGMDKHKANRAKLATSGAYGKSQVARVPAIAEGQGKPLTVEELFYAVVAEIGTRKAIHMLMAAHGVVESALSGVPTALKG